MIERPEAEPENTGDDINIQTYTPSILLRKGQWEFKNFNNLYSQNSSFNGGRPRNTGLRENYFSSINQFLYGLSPHLNVGFDVWLKTAHVRNDEGASSFEFLRSPGPMSDAAITGIGPKIKIAPFKSIQRLSIQSTLLFPLRSDLENQGRNRPFLEFDRNTLWITQFFYDKPIGTDFQLFFQFAPWVTFVRESFRENNFVQTPMSVFFSWFPTSRLTLYAQNEYWPTHYNSSEQSFRAFHSWFVQSGGGIKYQLVPGFLEIEGLYTNFWLGSDGEGAGHTLNVGFRIIN